MARRPKKELTERQLHILEVLDRYQQQHGYPPSIREICQHANISSTSVANYYLDQLEARGMIERAGRVSRGIRLVKPLSEMLEAEASGPLPGQALKEAAKRALSAVEEMIKIPLVGRIFASEPVPLPDTDFRYMGFVDIARSMLPGREKVDELFALEVRGDSMIDAMVNDGDYVIMRPAHDVRNGDMVAVWLEDKEETTLKYFYKEGKRVRLQPANPTMDPIYIDNGASVRLQGKVVMVIRSLHTAQ